VPASRGCDLYRHATQAVFSRGPADAEFGAIAGQALAGPSFRVTKSRGLVLPWPDSADDPAQFPATDPPAVLVATVHPSAVLRADDRESAYGAFVADLAVAAGALRKAGRR
jgi:uracil-DNA glycosylase